MNARRTLLQHVPCLGCFPRRAGWLAAVAFLVCGLSACNNDTGVADPNIPPETRITGSVPPDFGQSSNRVEILWSGTDVDGTRDYYEYILHTYPRTVATADEVRAALVVPAENDPRWTRHNLASIELIVRADTLRADPRQPLVSDVFDRWHTFYVRTVDKEGAHDATPAQVSFQAQSRAPIMWLQQPVQTGMPTMLPLTFVMNWKGFDPDALGSVLPEPDSTRWVLREATVDGTGNALGYPEALYDLVDSDWSPWKPWNAADSTGQQAVFKLSLPSSADKGYVFAVQGMDDGAAVTPQFDNTTALKNNWAALIVQPSVASGPRFTVFEDSTGVGPWEFNGIDAPSVDVAVSKSTVYLRWSSMATAHYGASPGEFRYGWNIVNPSSDSEWTDWNRSGRNAVPHTLGSGVEAFWLQARDVLGDDTHQVTTATIRFTRTP